MPPYKLEAYLNQVLASCSLVPRRIRSPNFHHPRFWLSSPPFLPLESCGHPESAFTMGYTVFHILIQVSTHMMECLATFSNHSLIVKIRETSHFHFTVMKTSDTMSHREYLKIPSNRLRFFNRSHHRLKPRISPTASYHIIHSSSGVTSLPCAKRAKL